MTPPAAEAQETSLDDVETRAFYGAVVNDAYRLKSELIAEKLAEIGMGKFQWSLFVVAGLGWTVDNFWSQGLSAIRPAMALDIQHIPHLSLSSVAYYTGLIIGAAFWGPAADIFGRALAFNATLLIGGIFACASAGATNFTAFCALWAVIGTAAGGNVPVDSIVFLEFVPGSAQWLLVTLSAWWNLGQLVVAGLAWGFLSRFSCAATDAYCTRDENMGWRYLMITLGGLALVFGLLRMLVFKIPESPRFLVSQGRDTEAVSAVNYIARYNGRPEPLTLEMLQNIDAQCALCVGSSATVPGAPSVSVSTKTTTTAASSSAANPPASNLLLSYFHATTSNGRRLFSSHKMLQHSIFTFLIWLTIGMAYPLYFAFITSYLQNTKSYAANDSFDYTYRVYCIVSAVGILGPLMASYCVETRLGRRWMMAVSAVLTGVFLFAYTAVDNEASDIGFQCATGILGNFEFAVMFAYTPESFPGSIRGTGTGIAATLFRVGGLAASLISTYSGYNSAPIYISAALWCVVGVFCLGLPFETRGHSSI